MHNRTQPPAELLSAYHDGEVSPAEREAVERWLAESAEAHQALAEMAQLGALLRAGPPDRLGPEFRSQVMAAAERAMLLPGEEPAALHQRSRRRTAFWVAAGGLLATTATVTVAVLLLDGPASEQELALHEAARRSVGAPSPDTTIASHRKELPESEPARRESEPGDGPRVAMRDAASEEHPAPARFSVAGENNDRVPLRPDPHLSLPRRTMAAAEIGEVLEAIDSSDDQLAVVRVTVIDREAGLGALRVLLQRDPTQHPAAERSRRSEAAGAQDEGLHDGAAANRSDADAMPAAGKGELFEAVLVQATPEQMAALFQELHGAEGVREVAVEEPITLARLDVASRRQFAYEAYELETPANVPTPAEPEALSPAPQRELSAATRTNADAAALARSAAGPARSAAADQKADASAQTAKDNEPNEQPAAIARQVSPTLSQLLLRGRTLGRWSDRRSEVAGRPNQQGPPSMAAAGASARPAEPAPPPATPPAPAAVLADKAAESASAVGQAKPERAPHQVQVLFVLVGGPPAEPAERPVPSDPASDPGDSA